MAGVTEGLVCTRLLVSSVYYCVKTSKLGNVCFIDCQDNFDALQLPACDLCLRFYEIVLSSGFILPIRPCVLACVAQDFGCLF